MERRGDVKLNAVETAMMNNPVRRFVQRAFEAPRLRAMGGPMAGGMALEVGCGQGYGVSLVLEAFGAEQVHAFDLDEKMVALASARHAADPRVTLWTGDATAIPTEAATYDAVFDFGILHHVPDWRAAVREVYRVLVPGGRFYAEEVLAAYIHHPLWRRIQDHPMNDRFDAAEWLAGLRDAGFTVHASRSLGSWFVWTIASKPA